jgi:DNA-binding transcriptional regulator LsrR (DeoR family)
MITDELLFEVAIDYYYNKMLQKDIAKKLGVSRVQISKYIKLAHERGIVNIEIIPPVVSEDISNKYKKLFKKLFGLEELILTKGHSNQNLLLHTLAEKTYNYLKEPEFDKELKIGVAWGSTFFKIATFNEKINRKNWTIIPLSGGTTKLEDKEFNMNYLAQSFADRTGAKAISIYLPFFRSPGEPLNHSINNQEFKSVQEYWNSLDVIICSVGYSISRSPVFRQGVFDGHYLNKLEELEVVGDVVTHYFDIDGNVHDLDYMKNITNISLEQYMKAKKRIVVAGGMHKVESILGLLRGKLTDVLISDLKTIENVVEYISEEKKGGGDN